MDLIPTARQIDEWKKHPFSVSMSKVSTDVSCISIINVAKLLYSFHSHELFLMVARNLPIDADLSTSPTYGFWFGLGRGLADGPELIFGCHIRLAATAGLSDGCTLAVSVHLRCVLKVLFTTDPVVQTDSPATIDVVFSY